MSDPRKSRSPKKKAVVHKVTSETQKNPNLQVRAGDLKTEMVKELFMKSEFVEWAPFCVSMKWNPNATRLKYPVANWVREKKEQIAIQQSEEIGDSIFRHKPQWHKDVLQVLKDAPKLASNFEEILKYRMNQISRMINDDIEAKNRALMDNRPYDEIKESKFFKEVKNSDLVSLSMALKGIIETRQKAVLINNWSVQVAEEFSKPETIMDEHKSQGFKVEVIGYEQGFTSAELQRWRSTYYDQPQLPAIVEETKEEPDAEG